MNDTQLTIQQAALLNAANMLSVTIEDTVPGTTANYAVEDLRRALRTFLSPTSRGYAGNVYTHDKKGVDWQRAGRDAFALGRPQAPDRAPEIEMAVGHLPSDHHEVVRITSEWTKGYEAARVEAAS